MVYTVYSVRDLNVGFGYPIVQDNDSVAMRSFEHGCMDDTSYWHTHPSDFSLYAIGSFDSYSGDLVSFDSPRLICHATDFVFKEVKSNGSEV